MLYRHVFCLSGLLVGTLHHSLSCNPAIGNQANIQTKNSPFLISELKGIVLLSQSEEKGLSAAKNREGVHWKDLDIPGHSEQLRKRLTPFLGSPVTHETLGELKRTIDDYYRENHRPFVLVKVPEQEVTTGVLQLVVMESRLGNLRVEGNKWTSNERIEKYCHVKSGDFLDESRLIQNISFINRNPFRRADLVFVPGKEEGTTDVVVSVKDRRSARVYTGSDDLGVEPLGANRWYAGFNWGNVFGLDHILSYQFTSSYNMHRFQAHTAEYTAPLSWGHLLDVYGGYSEVHPHVHYPFKHNDGWSMQTSLRYVIPLKIYPYLEHEITFGGDFKRSNNTFEYVEVFPRFGHEVNLTQAVLGYGGNYERNRFRLDFIGNFYWSPGKWLSDQTNSDYASLRPGAVNHWIYFRGSLAYLQRLPKSFSFYMLTTGQITSEPLLPSEQFGLGGYDSVRGYEQRELNEDNAFVVSSEFRSPAIPIIKSIRSSCSFYDALQFLVFLDYGLGRTRKTFPGSGKSDYLLGAGPGLRYTIEPYLTLRFDWGIRLHNKKAFEGDWNRIHFNVTASY